MKYKIKDSEVKYPKNVYIKLTMASGLFQVYQWCTEHFGTANKYDRWNYGTGHWYFRDEQDYMWFKLRWQ